MRVMGNSQPAINITVSTWCKTLLQAIYLIANSKFACNASLTLYFLSLAGEGDVNWLMEPVVETPFLKQSM